MQELNTFEGGEKPRCVDAGANLVLISLEERPQLCFKQAIIQDSHATAYGYRHTAEA